MARLPQTRAEVFYSYEIQIDNIVVGTLKTFNPRSTRTQEPIREVLTNGGEIFEIVPGVSTYQIDLGKVRLYDDILLNYFGIISQDLQKQVRAIDIVETIWKPANVPNSSVTGPASTDKRGSRLKAITYQDCWVTDWNKAVSTDSITIVENVTVQATRIVY